MIYYESLKLAFLSILITTRPKWKVVIIGNLSWGTEFLLNLTGRVHFYRLPFHQK